MGDNAAVYAPIHFFPATEQLEILSRGGTVAARPDVGFAEISWPSGTSIRFTRMPDSHVGDHLSQLHGVVEKMNAGPGLEVRVLSTLSVFGLVVEPGLDAEAIRFIATFTGACGGFCFIDEKLVDGDGNNLLETGALRPAADRVARRALVLLTVAFRALLEGDSGSDDELDSESLRQRLGAWFDAVPGLTDEIQPVENELLRTPIGEADPSTVAAAVRRAEGAQVLLWALGARDLPAHDEHEELFLVARDVGVLDQASPALLESPELRPDDELDWMRRRLVGIDWRLSNLDEEDVDLAEFATDTWFGGFDVDGIAMVDGDLAIEGSALAAADEEAVAHAAWTASERHRAANWLIGAHPVYTSVATPT